MELPPAILIIDDDVDVLRAAKVALVDHFDPILTAEGVDELEAKLANPLDAVLLDMNFALGQHTGRAGLDALTRIRAADSSLGVVLMTAYGSVSLAVEALKQGASDFVLKPWRNDKLVAAALAAAERTRSLREGQTLDLDIIERRAIEQALTQYRGNISLAASALGLSRPALYRRMAKHGLLAVDGCRLTVDG